jgi:hypothetical protein
MLFGFRIRSTRSARVGSSSGLEVTVGEHWTQEGMSRWIFSLGLDPSEPCRHSTFEGVTRRFLSGTG